MRLRLPFALLLLAAAPLAAQPVATEEDAVRRAAQALFDSWREADAAKGDAALHSSFRLTTRRDNNAPDDSSASDRLPALSVADRAAMMRIYANLRPGEWDDRLANIAVHADPSGIATFRANYRFHISGRLTHCGAVALILYRFEGRWQIADFADTHHWAQAGEPGGCEPPSAE